MDASRFDRLAKRLARDGISRRTLLQTLAAGVLTGLGRAAPAAAVICRQGGVLCAKDAQCCSGACVDYHCACPDGEILCRDRCILACTPLDACHVAGQCDPASGTCTNPLAPPNTPCGAGHACCNGVCTDITTTSNCGGCGVTCSTSDPHATPICSNEQCGVACNPGFHLCAGACVADASVTQCGPSCTDCTANAPANTVPACTNGACAYPCDTAHGASACGALCCGSGQTCCNGSCKQADGASCTADGDCCSGFCVEGTCQATCSAEGAACSDTADCCTGTCVNISSGTGVCCTSGIACGTNCCQANTACQTASCSGNTCVYNTKLNCCTQDSDCPASTNPCLLPSCDLATNTCGTKPAADNTSCGTNQVCCGGSCCGSGQVCTGTGCCTPDSVATTCSGKCGTVLNNCGQSIDCSSHCSGCCSGGTCEAGTSDAACGSKGNACVACSTSDPDCGGHCSSTFHICSYPGNRTACGHTTCTNDTVTYAGACDGQGNCIPGSSFSCSPYQCNATGTACLGDCSFDSDCVSGYYCSGVNFQCVPVQANGATCSGGDQCQSGNCVDGFCCDSACSGQCQACDVAGHQGTCTVVPAGDAPHGSRPACTGTGTSCGGSCDGTNTQSCSYPTTQCRAQSCSNGTLTHAANCTSGTCPPAQTESCAPYVCNPSGTDCFKPPMCSDAGEPCGGTEPCCWSACCVAPDDQHVSYCCGPDVPCCGGFCCSPGQCIGGFGGVCFEPVPPT